MGLEMTKDFTGIAGEKIDAELKSIGTAAGQLADRIQKVALSIIDHMRKNRDWPTAERWMANLIDALGKGMRANSLRRWAEKVGAFVWNDKDKRLVAKQNADFAVVMPAAIALRWEDAKPAEDYKPLSYKAAVLHLIANGEKDRKKLGDKSEWTDEKLAALRALTA